MAALNHIIIPAKDKDASASFLADILGVKAQPQWGPFRPVQTSNGANAFRMLPEIVWNMPPLGTINLHGSLLPAYRGAAPINWAIIHGETETGGNLRALAATRRAPPGLANGPRQRVLSAPRDCRHRAVQRG